MNFTTRLLIAGVVVTALAALANGLHSHDRPRTQYPPLYTPREQKVVDHFAFKLVEPYHGAPNLRSWSETQKEHRDERMHHWRTYRAHPTTPDPVTLEALK